MVITEQEIEQGIKTNEKLIGLRILLVIYLHDKRYAEAMEDIEELLDDPEMQNYREYLLVKQNQVRQAVASLSNKRRPAFLQLIFNFLHNPA